MYVYTASPVIKKYSLPLTLSTRKGVQILQQDGAPSQTSIPTSKFLKTKKIKVLQDRPAQSQDMNINEHVWGRMKEEEWKTKPKNPDEFWEEWKTDDFINKVHESLSKSTDVVLQAHGGHSGY